MSTIIWLAIIAFILVLIMGLIQFRTPNRVMKTGFAKLIYENSSLGDRLCELFYGVTMVTVMIGIINIFESGYYNIKEIMLAIALGVNITWGIIDGATVVYGGLVDKAEEDRLVNSLRSDKNNQMLRDEVKDSFQDTVNRKLSEEDQSKVVEMIQSGAPEEIKKYGATKDDLKVFLAILLMDFITVFPVVIPLYIVQGVKSAVFWSHFIAVALFVIIGMTWAKHLNRNMILAGVSMAILAMAIIAFTFHFGW